MTQLTLGTLSSPSVLLSRRLMEDFSRNESFPTMIPRKWPRTTETFAGRKCPSLPTPAGCTVFWGGTLPEKTALRLGRGLAPCGLPSDVGRSGQRLGHLGSAQGGSAQGAPAPDGGQTQRGTEHSQTQHPGALCCKHSGRVSKGCLPSSLRHRDWRDDRLPTGRTRNVLPGWWAPQRRPSMVSSPLLPEFKVEVVLVPLIPVFKSTFSSCCFFFKVCVMMPGFTSKQIRARRGSWGGAQVKEKGPWV